MEALIAAWRPFTEFAYFIAQILLVGGLFVAYGQLLAMKQDSRLRIKRTASEKAIEACDRYVSAYIPIETKFGEVCNEKKIVVEYQGAMGDFSESSIPATKTKQATARYSEPLSTELLNHLEIIAVVFMSGVGSEDVAFPVIGRAFCKTVRDHYDLISLSRNASTLDAYQSIVDLYSIWHARSVKGDLTVEKARLEKSISVIPDQKIVMLEERA